MVLWMEMKKLISIRKHVACFSVEFFCVLARIAFNTSTFRDTPSGAKQKRKKMIGCCGNSVQIEFLI